MTSEVSRAATGTDELLQSVAASVREAMCVLFRDGRILSSNDASAELDLEVHSELSLGARLSVRIQLEPEGS